MTATRLLAVTALCLLACNLAHAEGFFRASLEVVDDSAWPEVRLLLRVVDESGDGEQDYTALPNVHSAIDCPRRQCWAIELSEDGTPVEVLAQESAPLAPRRHVQFLWLRYQSPLRRRADVALELRMSTTIGAGGNRTAWNQPLLYPADAAGFPHMAHGPWKYLARYWDHHLNVAYTELLRRVPEAHHARLREAQRAWIGFRDADCAGLDDDHVPDAHSRCLALRSLERTTALEALSVRMLRDSAG